MKKFMLALMLSATMLFSAGAFAEASFNQIQTLIEKQEYRAAEKGLEDIIANHPQSAKAFYAMAQAQAGLGNLTKAQHALDKAMGLNPALDFAPASSVSNLKQAIHPQVAKIEVIEESHFWRNMLLMILFVAGLGVAYHFYEEHEKKKLAELLKSKKEADRQAFIRDSEKTAKAPVVKTAVKTTEPVKVAKVKKSTPVTKDSTLIAPGGGLADVKPIATTQVTPTPVQQPVVVNTTTNHSVSDMMLGAVIGHVLTKESETRKEPTREAPAKSSSWDEKPSEAPSRSSSWDDTSSSSSSRSSSWDDDSSSSRSSSWSSSSDSSSSSSWDSGSSDSGSSSSSWD